MSWLARSLANALIPDRHADEVDPAERADPGGSRDGSGEDDSGGGGVKEDFFELTQTLSRQFRGVAAFLAPPPTSSSDATPSGRDVPEEFSDFPSIAGLQSDLAEIGGRFRSGISRLSGSKAVTEISKIASTFIPFGPGDEEDEGLEGKYGTEAVGVTEEVMAFVRNISMHPETWLDFPLLPDDEESDDFDMSDAQQEHALTVERLAPRLAALRLELCPSHMSEGCFWKIYFVLLHPRLDKHDSEHLSTPQIVEARALLLQQLQLPAKTEKPEVDVSYRKMDDSPLQSKEQITEQKDLYEISPSETKEVVTAVLTIDVMTEKLPVQTDEVEIIDKTVIEEEPPQQTPKGHSDASQVSVEQFSEDEEGDDWLIEETEETGASRSTNIPLVNDEDVSFSDLED
ncbi:uncharacterized protein LOC122015009 [Zingiber officinale]|uniref:BSD domain-containing protein n=1 Tax=Zingiber officinale TaxID=94328 RepID=A0A8J5F975_ZINOF|nr:uncharacterized protein LOC122015009 [Zingiber officinale]KAG6482605.1 hypothetical protein ZIOFF_059237 [Zingiber officinale]